jgi:hypothetical protein
VKAWLLLGLSILLVGGPALAGPPVEEPQSIPQLLARMEATASHLESYEVTCEDGPEAKPHRYKLYFKQPNLVRIDASDGQVTVQPNGQIRGRRGKGLFGRISVKLGRNDSRLTTSQGIPFWETHFAATIARIRSQIGVGAASTLTVTPGALKLEVRCDQCLWSYLIDPDTLFFQEIARSGPGSQTETVRYRAFRPNIPLETHLFQF